MTPCTNSPTGKCQRTAPCRHACDLRVQPATPRDLAGLTNAELQAEIGRLQRELVRRVCGDPVQGIGLSIGGQRL